MITSRHIFHVSGYDPISPESLHRRYCRESAIFSRTWSVDATVGPIERCDGHPRWTTRTRGQNWTVNAVHEPLDWHDIVLGDIDRALPALLRDGFVAFFDFVASGTAARYFAASLGYTIFFLGPFLIVLLLAVAAIAIGGIVRTFGATPPLAALVVFVSFPVLMHVVGRRWRVQHALADWTFSRAYAYGERKDMARRVASFAARIAARVQAGDVDEIVCIGHSMGAIPLIEAIAQVLDRNPDIGQCGVKLVVLTVSSAMPKLSLHPAAGPLRDAATRVAAYSAISWAEYQTRDDKISFYKFHPVALRPLSTETIAVKPEIRRVLLRDMLSAATLLRRRLSLMRIHYQLVMANELRASYDYFMFVCGPVSTADLVRAPDGALHFLTTAGEFRHASSVMAIS